MRTSIYLSTAKNVISSLQFCVSTVGLGNCYIMYKTLTWTNAGEKGIEKRNKKLQGSDHAQPEPNKKENWSKQLNLLDFMAPSFMQEQPATVLKLSVTL